MMASWGWGTGDGGRGGGGTLGGRGSWRRGQRFRLSIFTAFAELPVQNHFLGDAGHLTVGHCVGSVSKTQGRHSFNSQNTINQGFDLTCLTLLYSYITLDTHFWFSDPFCMPGWFCFAKKNEVHQWPESCLGSPVANKMNVRLEICLVQIDFTISHFQNRSLYLGGVEWPLLCTQHCHRSCCWRWTQCALQQRYNTSCQRITLGILLKTKKNCFHRGKEMQEWRWMKTQSKI